jgi:hypothetical protein
MRRVVLLLASFGLLSATPAHAAGGPVPPAFGGTGVVRPGGDRYVALYAGNDRTVVTRIRTSDGTVGASKLIKGMYGIPGVTYDGVNTGLSADGTTLVLAEPINRYPVKRTAFRLLDGRNLHSRGSISLPGMVTLDAVSPDGRWLYFVDYKGGNAASYDVRAYDLNRHRLLRKPIVDPREPEEKLQGVPVTRVSSEDGRWAYTLYSGEEAFIHALDTEGRTAVCIDLPASVASAVGDIDMTLDDDRLALRSGGTAFANVDLKTFEVSTVDTATAAAPKPTATATPKPAAKEDSAPSLLLCLLPLAVLGAVAVLARQRRARRSATRSQAAAGHSG